MLPDDAGCVARRTQDHCRDARDITPTLCFALNQEDLMANLIIGDGKNNVADGLPVDLNYTRHGLMAGVTRRMTSNITSNMRYGFYQYSEPSTGGINNYTAHGVFATLVFKWP